ncbi:MAG: Arc family DNA-binding protein [Caulobacteraceae bacterium]
MPVNLSIKNAPDQVVERLRRRAERNHRSLQGELMAIIEAATMTEKVLSPVDLVKEVQKLGLSSPSESVAMIREDRDGR